MLYNDLRTSMTYELRIGCIHFIFMYYNKLYFFCLIIQLLDDIILEMPNANSGENLQGGYLLLLRLITHFILHVKKRKQ